MSDSTEAHIRERAERLWQEAGRPAGGPEGFLAQAREELVDTEVQDSFPASDPPSHTPLTGERAGG